MPTTPAGGGRPADAEAEIRSLSAEIVERYEEAALLYRLGDALGCVLGEAAIGRRALEEVSTVLGARQGILWFRSGEDWAVGAAWPGDGPPRWRPQAATLAVLEEGRGWIGEPAGGEPGVVAAALAQPGDRPLGLLALCGRDDDRPFRTTDAKLLGAVANLTAAFIRTDRLAAAARRAEARKREDEIARQVHRSLLPAQDAVFAGLDLSGVSIPAERIGGDYYGYLALPDGSLGLALADVSGHGVGAALYMAAMKGALQAEARRVLSPQGLLHRVNEALVADFADADVFATASIARVHPGAERVDYAGAGHHPPLLVRDDGTVERLAGDGGALGLLPEMVFEEGTARLAEGDLMLLFTDGLLETRNERGEFYGLDRLVSRVVERRRESARVLRERLLEDLFEHCRGRAPQDDITLLVARRVARTGEEACA